MNFKVENYLLYLELLTMYTKSNNKKEKEELICKMNSLRSGLRPIKIKSSSKSVK